MRSTLRPWSLAVLPLVLTIAGCGSSSSGADAPASAGPTGAGGSGGSGGGASAQGGSGGTSTTGGSGGSAGGTSAGGTVSGGSGGSGGSSASACIATGDIDIGGTWLALVRLKVNLQNQSGSIVSLCPTDQTGEGTFLAIVKMDQAGTTVSNLVVTVCDVELPQVKAIAGNQCDPTQAITAQIAPTKQLLDTLPEVSLAPLTGTLSTTQPGSTFTPERITYTLGSKAGGMNMAHWSSSPTCDDTTNILGTSTSCETMCVSDCTDAVDTDMDGAPGVTMTACGYSPDDTSNGTTCQTDDPSMPGVTLQGKAYLNFQVDPQLIGTVDSSCSMHGTADASIIYDIIGGDVRLVGSELTITEVVTSIPTFAVDSSASKFIAVRVDGKYGTSDLMLDGSDPKTACAAALQQQSSVFSN